MKQIFRSPAKIWQEGFPIGNGRMGAVIYGSPDREILQINEDTLWSGYPEEKRGGISAQVHRKAGELCAEGKYIEAAALIEKELEKAEDVEMYVPFGNVFLEFQGDRQISGYRRELDLGEAVVRIQYCCNGSKYEHTCFCSAPAQGIVYKIVSEERFSLCIRAGEGFLNGVSYVEDGFRAYGECPGKAGFTVTQGGSGGEKPRFSDRKKGMGYIGEGRIRSDGTCRIEEDGLYYFDAKELILYFGVRTGFRGYDRYPFYGQEDIQKFLEKDMAGAAVGFDRLMEDHIRDYRYYFDRVTLELWEEDRGETESGRSGTAALDAPKETKPDGMEKADLDDKSGTDLKERIRRTERGEEDPGLYVLLFDFGRYLLISSSRPGTQAANLQGIWNQEKIPPWFCDYTVNINTQMNYWMTGPCNLDELAEPFVRLNEELLTDGKSTAQSMGKKGSACFHNTDLWRKTSPATGRALWAYWPFGAAWMCRSLFEGYLFSRDIQYLRRIFPVLRENMEFCVDMLEETPEGLAVCPATSPENDFMAGEVSVPVAYYTENTLAIVRNLLRDYIEACRELGRRDGTKDDTTAGKESEISADHIEKNIETEKGRIENGQIRKEEIEKKEIAKEGIEKEEIERIQGILDNIVPPGIGKWGQIMEWNEDFEENEIHHRHLSHLYELHPGRGISPDTPDLFRAAKVSLVRRGDEGTGWSLAWKLLMWARLEDGLHFEKIMKMLFRLIDPLAPGTVQGGGLYANMFCAHPPFQIDGNLGYVAGVAEALLQSHNGEIVILPALPPSWKSGRVRGLRARGNILVDIAWSGEKVCCKMYSECRQKVRVRVRKDEAGEIMLEPGEWCDISFIQ